MSLDLYIKSNTPVLHRGTGVYIRDNGETKELTTKQEVLTHFPDINHNLTEMAIKCKIISICTPKTQDIFATLYDFLWHPKDNLGISIPNMDYLEDVMECYRKLLEKKDFFKQFNPSNGWGTYEQLLRKTKEYINALISISDNFDNYTIYADV